STAPDTDRVRAGPHQSGRRPPPDSEDRHRRRRHRDRRRVPAVCAGASLDLRPLVSTLAKSLAACGAMAATLVLFGTSTLSLADWVLGGAAGGIVYVA